MAKTLPKPKKPLGKKLSESVSAKRKELTKKAKAALAPSSLVRTTGRAVTGLLARDLPDVAGVSNSLFSGLESLLTKAESRFSQKPTQPKPVNDNKIIEKDVPERKQELGLLSKIYVELQTLTEIVSLVGDVTNNQLKEIRSANLKSFQMKETQKLKQQKKDQEEKEKSKFVPQQMQPQEEKKSWVDTILKALGFGLIFKAITGLPSMFGMLVGAVGALVPGLVAGLGGLLTGILSALGLSKLAGPILPQQTPKVSPTATQLKPANQNSSKTPYRDPNTGRFAKRPPVVKKPSMFSKAASGLGKVGKSALSLGSRVITNPATLVGSASVAAGTAAGYFGLGAVSDGIDKLTGKENTVGTALMNVVDSVTGKPKTELKPVDRQLSKAIEMKSKTEKIENFETVSKASTIINNNSEKSVQPASIVRNTVNNTNVIRQPLKTRNEAAWSEFVFGSKLSY